jgi:membrane protein DedA with SNARE-associated domain
VSVETLIHQYGYVALTAGTFLEGEMVVVAAGFAAHREYLRLPLVWLFAFLGSFAGDQFYFLLGRYKGRAILRRVHRWQPRLDRVHRYLERHQVWLLLSFRFVYGLRTVVPFAVGTSRVPALRFVVLNAVGGAVWALVVAAAGFYFGAALEALFGEIRHREGQILVAILALGFLSLAARALWRRWRAAKPGTPSDQVETDHAGAIKEVE